MPATPILHHTLGHINEYTDENLGGCKFSIEVDSIQQFWTADKTSSALGA